MGKINRIQLRGISRTPSDRMTSDGGCAESLNLYIDNDESAPAIMPEDVTQDIGLPGDLQAKKVFVHKTVNYENYIVVVEDKVVAYTPNVEDEEPVTVLELNGEEVLDIASVGNTLVVSTKGKLYYILYKNREYGLLGNKIPFPLIDFSIKREGKRSISSSEFDPKIVRNIEEEWNTNKYPSGDHKNEDIKQMLKDWWNTYDSVYNDQFKNKDLFASPFYVRYAIETYDGSLISSMPILVNAEDVYLKADATYERTYDEEREEEHVYGSISKEVTLFKVLATLQNSLEGLQEWADVYSSVNIYITRPFKDYINRNSSTMSNAWWRDGNDYFSANITLADKAEDALLLGSAYSFLVKKIPIFNKAGNTTEEFRDLINGYEFGPSVIPESGLEVQERLQSDDMKHYIQMTDNLSVYNNQLLLVQPSQLIEYDYDKLNARTRREDEEERLEKLFYDYEVVWLLRTAIEDKVVKKHFRSTLNEKIYPLQIFPDSRAYKMCVTLRSGTDEDGLYEQVDWYGEFDMYPHPYLDCAYCYNSFEKTFTAWAEQEDRQPELPLVNAIDELENKLFISEINNPFFFPVAHRFTFQSRVVGVAIASTALSQGQFGQFPLYVFTEDGIWVMETAADGSFISSKPMSRDVCVNADSITPIDNGVIFVSDKGVMLIQGSQVLNISPNMNGRHYTIENTVETIMEGQEFFKDFIPVVTDNTHFMAFVKNASMAYDYPGERLVLIKEDEPYQYIYKLDTNTWHKTAYGLNLVKKLNSYPECYVQGKREGSTRIYDLATILDAQASQIPMRGIIATRPFDLGEPDMLKTITDIQIRGQYQKGAVKFMLLGSMDGIHFYVIGSKRGKSWKLFRLVILADLEPTERISWVDIEYETKFTNRLR